MCQALLSISLHIQDIESLLHANGTVITMAMSTGQVPIEVQRAALNYVSTLCQVREIKDLPTSPLLDRLLPVMLSHPQDTDTLMQTKVGRTRVVLMIYLLWLFVVVIVVK